MVTLTTEQFVAVVLLTACLLFLLGAGLGYFTRCRDEERERAERRRLTRTGGAR